MWFLPVAALGLCAAVAFLDDLLPGRWAPAKAALLYTVLRAVTVGLLAVLGYSLTVVPPVLPLLLILGAVAFLPLGARLVLLGALSPLMWWPILQAQSSVTTTVPAPSFPRRSFSVRPVGLSSPSSMVIFEKDPSPPR